MGQSKELAQMTIKDLKEHHPDYYNQMHFKCRVCQNVDQHIIICHFRRIKL